MKKKVTVIDVAKKAGVSQTTVSRVLNDHPQIKEETRRKVKQAIEELEFSPNEVARSMVMKKTRTIGLVIGDISNPFYAEVVKVIVGKARQINYDVIITDTDYNYDYFEQNVKTLVGKRVDGILVASIHHQESIVNELFYMGFPIIYFNREPNNEDIHFISVNNEKGMSLAVQHLKELGHEKIALLSYPPQYTTLHKRYLGYMAAMKNFGLEIDESLVYCGEYTHENTFEFVSEVLARADKPTSFITTTDQQAISVMDSVSRLGFKIPEQISVVGFGDIDIASHPYISLTTISSQKKLMAELALEKLINLIESDVDFNSLPPIKIEVEPKLITRKTTGIATKFSRSK